MLVRPLFTAALLGLLLTACNKQAETPPPAPVPPAPAAVPALPPPVVLAGIRADYAITRSADGFTLLHKSGKDAPVNVKADQRIRFSDITMSFDTKGNPGAAYRLYYAAFNRAPDHAGLGFWLKALDAGVSLEAIAGMMVDSVEFAGMYAPSISHEELVRAFYKNLLRKDGNPTEIADWQAKLSSKSATRAQVLAAVSSSAAAQQTDHLDLDKGILYAEEGIKYQPFASADADPIITAAVPAKQ